MYASLLEWLNTNISIRPFDKLNSAGDKEFNDYVPATCMDEHKVTVLEDASGMKIVSNTILYIDGATIISSSDEIKYKGRDHPIKGIGSFSLDGEISVWMVYI